MTEDEFRAGEFRGNVQARLQALEKAYDRMQARMWWALAGVGSLAAKPYWDAIVRLIGPDQ